MREVEFVRERERDGREVEFVRGMVERDGREGERVRESGEMESSPDGEKDKSNHLDLAYIFTCYCSTRSQKLGSEHRSQNR